MDQSDGSPSMRGILSAGNWNILYSTPGRSMAKPQRDKDTRSRGIISDLQVGEPNLSSGLAQNPAFCLVLQAERVREDPKVLSVSNLGRPQSAGIHAGPHAALRAIRVDYFECGVMQVGARVGHVRSGTDEINLCVEVLEPGQTADLVQVRSQRRAGL